MLNPDHWTIPERYMVRYHLSQLVWWALGTLSLLIFMPVVLIAILATKSGGFIAGSGFDNVWWYVTITTSLVLTALSFMVKSTLFGRTLIEWSLHRVVTHYKRAVITTMGVCLLAGLIPCVTGIAYGEIGYSFAVVVLPVAAVVLHFPHTEKFAHFVEDTLAADVQAGQ